MALSEHIEEFSQRVFFVFTFSISNLFCFTDVKEIVRIFQAPAVGVKFLQFAPGEYFFASVKIAAFCGFYLVAQLFFTNFLVLNTRINKKRTRYCITCKFRFRVLFFWLAFSYFFLVPAA